MTSLARQAASSGLKFGALGRSFYPTQRGQLWQQTMRRSVHNTSAQSHTTILSSDKLASFNIMSLKALKNECRSRGLKVSGKKLELVERIMAAESQGVLSRGTLGAVGARKIHVSALLQKDTRAGATKPVDAVKMPDVAATEASVSAPEKDYILQIPPLSKNAAQKPVTNLEKQLSERNNADSTNGFPEVSTPDQEKVIFQSEAPEATVEIVNEEFETAKDTNTPTMSAQGGSSKEFSGRDKTFFLGFVTAVTGWWSLKLWE
ncbi:LAMI_0B07558g1_1 [Lachancea mirantina]|uniref:LAMI_0B07558g1_1 n=1 Tax=Lachancea mirantina TaxID=1230905 RepID=A0A1G4IXP6_9SACH|nr:LAMI_0B07558g1_1 [Lachancea mirantina]